MITVGNIKNSQHGYYIGRPGKGRPGSALANPYKLQNPRNDDERAKVIAQYRQWLWSKIQCGDSAVMAELNTLRHQAIAGDIHLLCFCAPRQCHGDVVKACLIWMISQKVRDGRTTKN